MESSDADSEADRRAYGQYQSLNFEDDSDVDEEAAAYLRSVRKQARGLPDVSKAPYSQTAAEEVESPGSCPDADDMEEGELAGEGAKVTASPEWIREFMKDFRSLRLLLRSIELDDAKAEGGADEQIEPQPSPQILSDKNESLGKLENGDSAPNAASMMTLSSLLKLDSVSANRNLEKTVQKLTQQDWVSTNEVYEFYSLAAAIESPLMAHTEATLGALLRHSSKLRKAAENNDHKAACLDVVDVVCGAYFGQDEALRALYREQDFHV